MLQIKDVRKKYVTGDFEQIALNGVSLNLRDNEFVAILGPSGSGKTTLLNIIGGLDRYDSGDLVINGISTKKYKDRDWDSYRNHTVGFVFQSYNLIPHQTVLANVELALTIGGISAAQRRERALDALEQVGLREQAHKRPNQMSGGQMQRVAIARALVNNPKILLADEPTGALDTKTSVQVMDLLKEVAKDRLVVMVTHNPELAEEYANRIVRVKDGNIIDDTNPLVIEEETPAIHKNLGRASMSLLTSFGLSLNNLLTKKGRTFLTAFAGSIGIIGIALILSLSTGFQNYIDQIQEETMTSYPLTIYQEATDVLSAILTMQSEDEKEPADGTLVEQQYIETMMGSIATNDLKYFQKYLEDHSDEYSDTLNRIKYSYSVSPLIYTVDAADQMAQVNPNDMMSAYMGGSASMMGGSSMGSTFSEISDLPTMQKNYDLLAGSWPTQYNELVAVVTEPNQISDLLLYSLGFRDTKELKGLIQKVMSGELVNTDNEPMTITYDDLMNLELKLVDPTSIYKYNKKYKTYEDMSKDEKFMKQVYENAEDLKIVGIACANEENGSMNAGIKYLPELTCHVIDQAEKSEIVQKQLKDKNVDVFSGNDFDDDEQQSGLNFQDMISIDEDKIKEAFQTNTDGLDFDMDVSAPSLDIDTSSLSGLGSMGSMDMSMDASASEAIIMGAAQTVADNLEGMTQGMVQLLTTVDEQAATTLIQGYLDTFTVNVPAVMPGFTPGSPVIPGMGGTGDGMTMPDLSNGLNFPDNYEDFKQQMGEGVENFIDPGLLGRSAEESLAPMAETGEENASDDPADTGSGDSGVTGSTGDADSGSGSTGDAGSGSGSAGDAGSDANVPGESGTGSGEGTPYLMLSAMGMDLVSTYKAQALNDDVINELVKQMSSTMGGDVTINSKNLKKVVEEAYDNYFAGLTPNEMGMVPVSDLPDSAAIISEAIANNQALIFQEAYDIAKDYTTLMVAAGMGGAIGEIMTPMISGISESMSGLADGLSGLSGLADSLAGLGDSMAGLSGLGDLMNGEDLFSIDQKKFAEAFQFDMDEEELSRLMESMMTGETASYSNNLLKLGYQDLEDPTSISFYFKNFESKGNFIDWLENFNDTTEEDHKLTYSDLTGLLMGSVETIINSVTYVLIAFVSISLIVSSIMIGIITYISVLERTKEIGILRAIGASKRNISSIFNAETFIIGFLSGLIGIGATYLLNIPINMVIHNVTNNPDITAVLNPVAAVILVIISTILTMIGGLIPSASASRKDPVIALRTE